MDLRHVDLLLVLRTAFHCTKQGGRGSARASPVAAPMPKSVSSLEKNRLLLGVFRLKIGY